MGNGSRKGGAHVLRLGQYQTCLGMAGGGLSTTPFVSIAIPDRFRSSPARAVPLGHPAPSIVPHRASQDLAHDVKNRVQVKGKST